ncbi:uncharacterized protein LOC122251402 [Penaeus japonicus]|uniref:uncharacterized protein LOC122251402 n=1 Tax=Penaeus japonicus TaxID=27405 RepID=UPI001C70EC28|nr:uncharacterized protein LOC122251402 [Penaeus japonicus]XP_042869274.1 uncharacterized protein LOC122251402 [Penaeus japonicus]
MHSNKVPSNYFKLTHPGITIFLAAGIGLMFVIWLAPHSLSPTYFGYLADAVAFLGTEYNGFVKVLVVTVSSIHFVESLVGIYVCYQRRIHACVTLAWTLQILAVGMISLRFLIWPEEEVAKSSKKVK